MDGFVFQMPKQEIEVRGDGVIWMEIIESERNVRHIHFNREENVEKLTTHLAKISFNSCSDTNWPKFATKSVEHGALADIGWLGGWVVPVIEPTGLANAGLAKLDDSN